MMPVAAYSENVSLNHSYAPVLRHAGLRSSRGFASQNYGSHGNCSPEKAANITNCNPHNWGGVLSCWSGLCFNKAFDSYFRQANALDVRLFDHYAAVLLVVNCPAHGTDNLISRFVTTNCSLPPSNLSHKHACALNHVSWLAFLILQQSYLGLSYLLLLSRSKANSNWCIKMKFRWKKMPWINPSASFHPRGLAGNNRQ